MSTYINTIIYLFKFKTQNIWLNKKDDVIKKISSGSEITKYIDQR